jgi:hypothetical protein
MHLKNAMRWLGLAASLAVLLNSAIAADRSTRVDWKARIQELAQPADDEVVLIATGDALWNRSLIHRQDPAMHALFDLIRAGDISFVNFEQVLADSGHPVKVPPAKAESALLAEFEWAGFDLVSLANNHIMDFGLIGLETTLRALDRTQIKYSGAGRTLAEALEPALVERKGLKVALLAFMAGTPFERFSVPATPASPGTAAIRGTKVRLASGKAAFSPWEDDMAAMENAIKEAKKSADFVAVSMHTHWPGDEDDTNGRQLIMRSAIDAGADAVLGTGPRDVNGIELYNGRPIFHGIGNLVFQFSPEAYELFPDTLPYVQELATDPKYWNGLAIRMILSTTRGVRRIEVLPVRQAPGGTPYLAVGAEGDAILENVKARSSKLGATLERRAWYGLIELGDRF